MADNLIQQTEKLLFSESELNLLNYHRDKLENNTYLENEDGSLTTVYITGVLNPKDNRIYNVPGYVNGRKDYNEDELRQIAEENNWYDIYPSYELGPKENPGLHADRAAQELHKLIEEDGLNFRRKK